MAIMRSFRVTKGDNHEVQNAYGRVTGCEKFEHVKARRNEDGTRSVTSHSAKIKVALSWFASEEDARANAKPFGQQDLEIMLTVPDDLPLLRLEPEDGEPHVYRAVTAYLAKIHDDVREV